MNLVDIFKALADQNRLLLVQSLIDRPLYVEVLAERLSLAPATVTFHLKKLEAAGIVQSKKDQYYKVFEVNKKILDFNLIGKLASDKDQVEVQENRENRYEQKTIKSFIKYGRLQSIPVQRKKRLIILKHLLAGFESSKRYQESEVNEVLEKYHQDVCTLRREMIAEGLMARNKAGVYWVS